MRIGPMLEVQGLSGAAIARLGCEWRALFDRVADATPFQSWEWISSAWQETGRGRPWILCARQGGQLVGVLPLVLSGYRGLPVRRLRFLGARLSEYQDLLALPEERDACRDAFVRHLQLHADRWHLIDLTDVPAESTLGRLALGELLGAFADPAVRRAGRVHFYAEGDRDRRTVRLVVSKPGWSSAAALGVHRIERELERVGSRLRNRL